MVVIGGGVIGLEVAASARARDMGDKTTPLVPTARHGYFRLRDEGYGPADLTR